MSTITVSAAELVELTGYRQPAHQLRWLHEMGYWRAKRSNVTGQVILEREHQRAVSSGMAGMVSQAQPRPRVRPVSAK